MRSMINSFLVRKDNRVRVKDVKVVRGTEIRSGHNLVLLKMSRKSRVERHRRLEKNMTDRLKDKGVRLKFEMRLKQKMNIIG